MLSSVLITASTQSGVNFPIPFVVLNASSQWVIGQNDSSEANILELDSRCIQLLNPSHCRIRFTLLDRNFHVYIAANLFC